MTHNLKVLGLALVAVFALSAMAASAASADEFTAESYPTTVTGKHDPSAGADTFITTSGSVKCPDATYHGTISGGSTTLTITPSFNGATDSCTAFGFPAIVETNGCDFLFHIEGHGSTIGTVDLVCPAGKDLTVTAGQNTAGNATTKCTIHVPPQTGIIGITYSNIGTTTTREIRIGISANNIKYTHTTGTGLGHCVGAGATEQEGGEFTGTDILTGETDPTGANHIGLFLSTLP